MKVKGRPKRGKVRRGNGMAGEEPGGSYSIEAKSVLHVSRRILCLHVLTNPKVASM